MYYVKYREYTINLSGSKPHRFKENICFLNRTRCSVFICVKKYLPVLENNYLLTGDNNNYLLCRNPFLDMEKSLQSLGLYSKLCFICC